MRLFPVPDPACRCGADVTAETVVQRVRRSGVVKAAKQVFHVRGVDRMWHWSDQDVIEPQVVA